MNMDRKLLAPFPFLCLCWVWEHACVSVFGIIQFYVGDGSWLLPDHKRDPKIRVAAWYPLKTGRIVSFQLGFSEK